MYIRRSLIALALFAGGCSDEIGPHPTAVEQRAQPLHFLRWAGGAPPQFGAIGALSEPVDHASRSSGLSADLESLSGGLSLNQYTATFWAVHGQPRSLQINYRSFAGDTTSPFLRLRSVDPASVPGRGALALGDSVLITVSVDPYTIKVSLEPTGLRFSNPAQLRIWYGGAGGDLNGDGVVDSTDARIERQLLGMWYREGDSAWTQIPADKSLEDKTLTSWLQHFCDYAVSW